MRHILARANREVLEQFAWSNVLVALDFDGTLAPIVREPDRARMRATTRALLQAVARIYPTLVISGRGRADVAARVRGTGLRAVIGNHGIEPGHTIARRAPRSLRRRRSCRRHRLWAMSA
jgi:trehalose 6-phosphate phosphatase